MVGLYISHVGLLRVESGRFGVLRWEAEWHENGTSISLPRKTINSENNTVYHEIRNLGDYENSWTLTYIFRQEYHLLWL